MRYLFVHQNFPGQFLHLLRHLAAQKRHDIVFITEATENVIPGVRLLTYTKPEANEATFTDARELEVAFTRARIVAELGGRLKGLGFTPDVVVGHHGWGELLNIGDVWPGVPVLGYFEFFYHPAGLDVGFDTEFPEASTGAAGVRVKNTVNLLALANPGHGQTPTRFQHETYPGWARPRISVLAEGVDLQACRPEPAVRGAVLELDGFRVEPGDTLVTYVARDLEPYRGFHVMMRALPGLLALSPRLKVVMVGGDGVSYGARLVNSTWREYFLGEVGLGEVGGRIDPARVCFPGRVPYGVFVRLLQRSDAHVYLTYPFVLSWSLREALACGCALVASDTAPVREFVSDGRNGLLVDFFDPGAVVAAVGRLLDDPALARRVRRGARAFAERHLRMDRYLGDYEALISRVVSGEAG